MKKAEWYDVLGPREAVIAGLVGLAVVWPLTYYAYRTAYYASWGLTLPQWRALGTAIDMLGFVLPYWATRWWVKTARR